MELCQRWGDVLHDRRAVPREVVSGLPSVQHLVLQPVVDVEDRVANASWGSDTTWGVLGCCLRRRRDEVSAAWRAVARGRG